MAIMCSESASGIAIDTGKPRWELVCDLPLVPNDYPFILCILVYGNIPVLTNCKRRTSFDETEGVVK